ncbi:GGDEF domain-containing protein [Okeania sp. KiyG1]|uniref:GGDEF domain-containing protein n=1 Tax=Okeania sp. KiyG1 TaxID=2720165 RepID=UPI0019BDF8CF|nr:GGDEF domain-containing protein [Okeania sp. KiyG1]GGA38594.1 hypothetical protein CYANOKiyG1_56750 [Okeania sp. KiyG1]
MKQEQEKLKQEIQQRKEAEAILYQSRALISSILRSSLDGVAALEAVRNPKTGEIEDFRCLEVNPIIAEVFNQERENLIGKFIFRKFIDKIDPDLFAGFIRVVETGISLQKDFNYKYKEEQKWYSCIAVKLADGFAVTVRDITERKILELELNRLATIDGLTGVYNRPTFDKTLAQEWQRSQREKQPLSLILFDADYFKLYNDYYGHQAGDNCLVQIAQVASKMVKRPGDFVARYGGEEFVIILPNTDRQGAIAVAEGIRQAIEVLAIPHERSEVSPVVSVSMGIACVIPTTDSSPEILISMADRAMYKAKQQGRNLAIAYRT